MKRTTREKISDIAGQELLKSWTRLYPVLVDAIEKLISAGETPQKITAHIIRRHGMCFTTGLVSLLAEYLYNKKNAR